jgi:hypothetical protein
MAGEAKKFELQLNQEWLAAQEDIHEAVELIGLEAFKRIVEKSPVDTGRFRGNWNADIGTMNEATTENTDKDGAATMARAATALSEYSSKDNYPDINITNGLPYSQVLEDGWPQIGWHGGLTGSPQAPNGMVALTITEIEAMFDGYEV